MPGLTMYSARRPQLSKKAKGRMQQMQTTRKRKR